MAQSTKFGKLLTEAIWRIKFLTSKSVEVIQEELGYAIEKKGGASIERWRQGYIPANLSDLEALTRNLVDQTDFEPAWFEEFLRQGDHPYPERFCHHLFPSSKESPPIAIIVYIQPDVDVRRANTDRLIPAQFAMPLYRGDVVYTYAEAVVHLVCSNGLLFNVTEESNLTITCQAKPDDKRIIGHWDTILGSQLLKITTLQVSNEINLPDITEAERVIRNAGLDSKARAYLLACLYRQYGKLEEAIDRLEWLTKVQKITSTYLSQQLGDLYYELGHYTKAEEVYQAVLIAAQAPIDKSIQAMAYLGLAHVAKALNEGERAIAYLKAAHTAMAQLSQVRPFLLQSLWLTLQLSTESLPSQKDEALVLFNNAIENAESEAYAESILLFEQLINQELDEAWEISTKIGLALCHLKQGAYEQAQQICKILINNDLGDEYSTIVGIILHRLGEAYHLQRKYREALAVYHQVLTTRHKTGDRTGEGAVLYSIGITYYIQGDYAKAIEAFQDLLTIQQERGDQLGQEAVLHLLGTIYHIQGDYEQTLNYYRQALAIQNKLSDRSGELESQYVVRVYYALEQDKKGFFDRIHFIQDRYEEIVTYYRQTLTSEQKASGWVGEDEAKYTASTREQDKEAFLDYIRSLAKELASVILPDLADGFEDAANLFFAEVITQPDALKSDPGFFPALSLGGGKLELLELLVATYITTQLIVEVLSSQEFERQLRENQLIDTARHQAENVAQDLELDPLEVGTFAKKYARLLLSHNLETLRDLIKP